MSPLGKVTLDPQEPVVAGSVGTWTVTLSVGSYGIDEGGTIKIAQRFASDWQPPQFERPGEPGYSTVATDGDAKLNAHFEKKGHDRPWMKCLVIDVYDGSLAPGDTVTIVLGAGDTMRAQTFIESAHEFRVFVDPTNACVARAVPNCPTIPVVAGEPVEWVCIVPTQAIVGEPVDVFIKGQDQWGNPTPAPPDLALRLHGRGDFSRPASRLVLHEPGTARIVTPAGSSNPITACESEPKYKRYWGDLHAQSDATVGTGTEVEYFTFARDVAQLDFTSHQGNDFQMDDEDWRRLDDVVRDFHDDGRFVVFPGYEWSANTPAGGDRNVFYFEEGLPIIRSSHWQTPQVVEDELTPAHPADEMFARIRKHVPLDKVLLGSHVGGRWADIRKYFDEQLGPLVEIVSCWGVFEWMLFDAFDKGYTVGVMCNSDGHKGRPGAEGPGAGEFGIAGGLTCVLATDLTRAGVWDALKNRRCYGTTGARIDLDFTIHGEPMGSVVQTDAGEAIASVKGAGPVESLMLYHGNRIIEEVRAAAFDDVGASNHVRVIWSGSRMRGRGRRANWSGAIRTDKAVIQSASTYCFDSAADGITSQSDHEVQFHSQTTGDRDGIDLVLDNSREGELIFDSAVGEARIPLGELEGRVHRFDFGGLDMQLTVQRYPAALEQMQLQLQTAVQGAGPYFVKAVQCDGQMAWSSPIYLGA